MFQASWNGPWYGPSLFLDGDTRRYVVRWGDGETAVILTHLDGDHYKFSGNYWHDYAADGEYRISVSQFGSDAPAVQLRAYLHGNATDDRSIQGSRVADLIILGAGDDIARGKSGDDSIDGGTGDDRLYGGDGRDMLEGGRGADILYGGDGSDFMSGGAGRDRLEGNAGDDFLDGGAGNDIVSGGDGDDSVGGGAGADRLIGGAGADYFRFDYSEEPAILDLVTDFAQGIDRLDLTAWFYAPSQFIGTAAFTGAGVGDGEVRYMHDGSDTIVEGDYDGNGTADYSFRITGLVDLQAGDFIGL